LGELDFQERLRALVETRVEMFLLHLPLFSRGGLHVQIKVPMRISKGMNIEKCNANAKQRKETPPKPAKKTIPTTPQEHVFRTITTSRHFQNILFVKL